MANNTKDLPKVVCLKKRKGEIVQDCDIYIGRAMYMGGWQLPTSKWANPFRLKDYNNNLDLVLQKYEEYIRSKPDLISALPELSGKILGCWCRGKRDDDRCHGDILAKLYQEILIPESLLIAPVTKKIILKKIIP